MLTLLKAAGIYSRHLTVSPTSRTSSGAAMVALQRTLRGYSKRTPRQASPNRYRTLRRKARRTPPTTSSNRRPKSPTMARVRAPQRSPRRSPPPPPPKPKPNRPRLGKEDLVPGSSMGRIRRQRKAACLKGFRKHLRAVTKTPFKVGSSWAYPCPRPRPSALRLRMPFRTRQRTPLQCWRALALV